MTAMNIMKVYDKTALEPLFFDAIAFWGTRVFNGAGIAKGSRTLLPSPGTVLIGAFGTCQYFHSRHIV
jgi:hypothetical protein